MDWIQLHLALNHVPVVGVPLTVMTLVIGWGRRSRDIICLALWTLVLLSAAAIAIKFTGDFAAEQSATQLVPVQKLVSAHEQAGDQATTGVFLLGLAATLALFLTRRGALRHWSIVLVMLLGLVASLLYARSAHSGGQISHPELRSGDPGN